MPNCLFGFSTRNAERMIPFSPGSTPKSLHDICRDRLGGLSELLNVNQPPGTRVDQSIDFISDHIGGVEHRKVPMVCHAREYSDSDKRTPPNTRGSHHRLSQPQDHAPFGSRAVRQPRSSAAAP
jgi:hypothetical protein